MIVIKHLNGYVQIETQAKKVIGATLEKALAKLDEGEAPAELVAHAAQLLEAHLGKAKTDLHQGVQSV